MQTAIIGGTGVYGMAGAERRGVVQTPYGEVEVKVSTIRGKDIVFLARHGTKHAVPPHMVNYRANIWALHRLGIKYIYATCAVGSCNQNFKPGDIVVLKDFIDFTKRRPVTFYDGHEGVIHTSMSDPYCRNLRGLLGKVAEEMGLKAAGEATYVCTEGPRFETAAEIKMFQMLGGDVVGMTNVPEVTLAKELNMCYAAVGIVTNWCTGFGEEPDQATILQTVEANKTALTDLFVRVFLDQEMTQERCTCRQAVMQSLSK